MSFSRNRRLWPTIRVASVQRLTPFRRKRRGAETSVLGMADLAKIYARCAKIFLREASQIATTAGCLSFRSTEMA